MLRAIKSYHNLKIAPRNKYSILYYYHPFNRSPCQTSCNPLCVNVGKIARRKFVNAKSYKFVPCSTPLEATKT
jgi:hypothetical protein